MQENQSSYRSIMKATSLFGGVQVFSIFIAIVRSKIIAVLLGPTGMGIMGLLTSTIGFVSSFTNFGLGTSAIRDIAAANDTGNQNRISKVVIVFRRLVWVTGLFGVLVTFVSAPWLSQFTFGDKKHSLAFMLLSCSLLFNQLTSGQNVLLQGMRKLKYLAKANLIGSFIGLLISIPLYYYYRVDGIVPAIVLTSLFLFVITWFFARKIKIERADVTSKETIFVGKGMLKMGFMVNFSGLITASVSYIVSIYISNTGKLVDVGLYNAGFAIISTYVGLVFTAMSTDYYPRLSGVSNDNNKGNLLINQQAEISLLILSPILAVFLIFSNLAVLLLYSSKFTPVNGLIQWAALGMYFKAASWSIGFILLAKGASKIFFWSEVAANTYMLLFNILGYKYFGLTGMGFSFLVSYIFVLIQVYSIANYKYNFYFSPNFFRIFGIQIVLGIICFVITKFVSTPIVYFWGLPLIFISSWYSFLELDKRMDFKGILKDYKKIL